MASGSKESPSNNPGLNATPDEATKGYILHKADKIGITVDDTYKACESFERLGAEFIKKPDDGDWKGIAFIKDPDGYWIEIYDAKSIGRVVVDAA